MKLVPDLAIMVQHVRQVIFSIPNVGNVDSGHRGCDKGAYHDKTVLG
jgi:hypothetical protein